LRAERNLLSSSNRFVNTKNLLKLSLVAIFAVFVVMPATTQSNEVGVTVGGYIPAGTTLDISPAFYLQGSFAHRLAHVPLVSLYGELPVAHTFNTSVSGPSGNYSATFVVPGVKVKFAPSLPMNPWLSLGVGVSHFSASQSLTLSGNTSQTSAVFGVGGGLDVKIAPFVSLRGEARDYYTGGLNLLAGVSGRQHNILAGAGLVLRF
jgi:hypothetical protein